MREGERKKYTSPLSKKNNLIMDGTKALSSRLRRDLTGFVVAQHVDELYSPGKVHTMESSW